MKHILFGVIMMATLVAGTSVAFAQEIVIEQPLETPLPVVVEASPEPTLSALEQEIASLRSKEQESNFITRFLIRLMIQELENKLNIKKALQ